MIKITRGQNQPIETNLSGILQNLGSNCSHLTWRVSAFYGSCHEGESYFGYPTVAEFEKATSGGKFQEFNFDDILIFAKRVQQAYDIKVVGVSQESDLSIVQIECFDSSEWTIDLGQHQSELLLAERIRKAYPDDIITIEQSS